jgi:hypothetical protein
MDGGAWAFTIERNGLKKLASVKSYSVDDLLKIAGSEQIDILKLDIEGAEKELFSDSTDWIEHVSNIVIELHDRFRPGCAEAFYKKISQHKFNQRFVGENIFISLKNEH